MTRIKIIGTVLLALAFAGGAPRLEAQLKDFRQIDFPKKEISSAVIPIPGACHNQGIAFDDNFLYLSCVDIKSKRALLFQVSRLRPADKDRPDLLNKLDLTEAGQYHPSGLDINGACLWVAVADYHPAPAKSTIKCIDRGAFRNKTGKEIQIPDHIGALAASPNWIAAFNWDAKDLYLIDYSGKILAKGPNPGAVAYQDCKSYKDNLIICSGGAGALSGKGFLDMIEIGGADPRTWILVRRGEINATKKLAPLTREGMAWREKYIYFLPGDSPNPMLYQYEFPEFLD